jgi:hypothetical protein
VTLLSPFAVRELTQSRLSWIRGPTQLDVEGTVSSSLFLVSAAMSLLSDDQVAATLSVDAPMVDVQFLVTAERLIVGGLKVGASLASMTLQVTQVPGDSMFDVTLGCLDTNITKLEAPLPTSAFTTLVTRTVIAASTQQGSLEFAFEVRLLDAM